MITKQLNDNDAFRNLLDFQNGETIRTLWRTHKKAVQSLAEFNLTDSLKELYTQFGQNEESEDIE